MILLKESVQSKLILCEASTPGDKFMYLEGVFAQAEKKNRNSRVYPIDVMKTAIGGYIDEYVKKNRALGEISHPESRPEVKPELASHMVTELKFNGNDVLGRARILETPQGQILKGLVKSGVQMGVSTRGLGSVTEAEDSSTVNSDYVITAIDAVIDPSGIDCFVDAVNESKEWLITDDGRIIEKTINKLKGNVGKMDEAKKAALFLEFIKSL